MGSSGYGMFGNYRFKTEENDLIQKQEGPTGSVGNIGDGQGETGMPNDIKLIRLEDVAISDYYLSHKSLPNAGVSVNISDTIHNGRLVVVLTSTGEILGNLPTQYNYLVKYINRGINYIGAVDSSGVNPIPFLVVSLHV